MVLIELETPAAEPVSAAQIRAFARIEREDEDGLLTELAVAARQWVERETGLVLAVRTFRLVLDPMHERGPSGIAGRVRVAVGPLRAVRGVRSYDRAGRESVHDASSVTIEGESLAIAPALRGAASLEIEFEAGVAAVAEALRQAMLRIAASGYETRGAFGPAMQPAFVPAFARALVAPFRQVRL